MKYLLSLAFCAVGLAQTGIIPTAQLCVSPKIPSYNIIGVSGIFSIVQYTCIDPPIIIPPVLTPPLPCTPYWGVFQEVPQGAIDGTNKTYITTAGPINGSQLVFVNGLLNTPGKDYTVGPGNVITFTNAPPVNSILVVFYRSE